MNSLASYIDYFEQIATQLAEIRHTPTSCHFVRINTDELFEGLRIEIKERVLLLEDYNTEYIDNNGSMYKSITGALSFLKFLGKNASYQNIVEAKDWGEKLCLESLLKMNHDAQEGLLGVGVMVHLEKSETLFMKNIPLGWYGARTQFSLTLPISECIDESAWVPVCAAIGNAIINETFIVGCQS